MAEIELLFYDAEIVETEDAIESPPAVASCDDIPTLEEACSMAATIVFMGTHTAVAVTLDGLFFVGITMHGPMMKVIHTPAADAFFDEHYPGWRHGLALPISLN